MVCTLLTPRVGRWLRHSRPARILHLFDQVCNLVNDQGDVISLASPAVGPGPFTMILAADFPNYLSAIKLSDPIHVDTAAQTVNIGPLRVETSQAGIWDPIPEWSRLRHSRRTNWPEARPLSPHLETSLQQLLQALISADTAAIRAATRALAGLGGGLTPSGDDILIGVLYALWVCDRQQDWRDLIVKTAVPRTTTLSAAFLQAAAAAEATIHWHHLVDGRAAAVAQIQAIGHTSGRDAWTGFIRTREALCRSLACGEPA